MSSTIRVNKICEYCGNEFVAQTTVTRYCSHRCNNRAYKSGIRKGKTENSLADIEKFKANKIIALNEKQFLSIKEVCVLTGIGRTNLYNQIKNGTLIPHKIGSRTIFTRSSIDNLFKITNYESSFKKKTTVKQQHQFVS